MKAVRAGAVTAATITGVAGVLLLNPPVEEAQQAAGSAADSPVIAAPETGAEDTIGSAATTTPEPATPSAAGAGTTVTGTTYNSPYGPMQVEATIADGRIVDIQWIQLPGDRKSQAIAATAAPQLVEEALSAQSAQVDTISGATWTSEGFRVSLQSILQEAGL